MLQRLLYVKIVKKNFIMMLLDQDPGCIVVIGVRIVIVKKHINLE